VNARTRSSGSRVGQHLDGLVVPIVLILAFGIFAGIAAHSVASQEDRASSTAASGRREELGICTPGSCPSLHAASAGQVILAYGDLTDSGGCFIRRFVPGEPVTRLGTRGTYRLVRISGSADGIKALEGATQATAASEAGGSCPFTS
jgi:hypothetical protein